ncbi:MAG TPA: hypothetical protein VGL13_04720, partial [Polyangiaceae bacterium]
MARFKRDEQRTYPLTWLIAGGLFVFSALWACYAELVTRVPWEREQEAFFDMEYQLAKESLARAKNEFAATQKADVDQQKAKKKQLEDEQKNGRYAAAKAKQTVLSHRYAAAEQGQTFGKSDLDEAYYYRQLAEYDRDAVEERARKALEELDRVQGRQIADAMLADPAPTAPKPGQSAELHHLEAEIARNSARAEQIDHGLRVLPAKAREAWEQARDAERLVVAKLKLEVQHQTRIDQALADMARIEGPADPAVNEKDDSVAAKLRGAACQLPDLRETRRCIQWLDLDPVDNELGNLDRAIAKAERPVEDARLRLDKGEERAHPKLNPKQLVMSLVGPYQIQQVVTHWQDAEADVDREAVDRCQTCHQGVDGGNYTDAKLPRQFRTHPFRKTLFTAHPIEKYGCTPCHQGQGRATDDLAHSTSQFEETSLTGPRWKQEGDKFWEDALYPIGLLRHVVVDDSDDSLAVKIGSADWHTLKIPHRNPSELVDREAVLGKGQHVSDRERRSLVDYPSETSFFGKIQSLLRDALDPDDAKAWHVVVRKTDNRVQLGVEQNSPTEVIDPKQRPKVRLRFPQPELAELLGFAGTAELDKGQQIYTAPLPPSVPVRSDAPERWDEKGRYTPPTARKGLQVPPDFRDRFIQAIPEAEGGCLRCHGADVDLRPHDSKAKFILSKLDRQKAEAEQKANPKAYHDEHKSEDLPELLPDPAADVDPVPLLTEGRYLFRKLNCTGCHILEGVPGNRNAGPELNDITAKVAPEWLLKWIRYPRAWRHKTRMPNL